MQTVLRVALFVLAFLPQFIAPAAANKTLNFASLGLLFNLNALPIIIGYGLGAAWVSKRLHSQFSQFSQFSQSSAMQSAITWLERGAGALFVYFGVKLALADNRTDQNLLRELPEGCPPHQRLGRSSERHLCGGH